MNKADQLSKFQGKGTMGEQVNEIWVQDVRGGLEPTDNQAIHNNNDAFIEGVRYLDHLWYPISLPPPAYALWS